VKVALHNRIKRLEERVNPCLPSVWHRILLEDGETKAGAIERYAAAGNVVGENDNFIFRVFVHRQNICH
jgi:hypothetical protein